MKNNKTKKKQDGKFKSTTLKHNPQTESAIATFENQKSNTK